MSNAQNSHISSEEIDEFLEGAFASIQDADRIVGHLESCPDCAERARQMEMAADRVDRMLEEIDPQKELGSALMKALASLPQEEPVKVLDVSGALEGLLETAGGLKDRIGKWLEMWGGAIGGAVGIDVATAELRGIFPRTGLLFNLEPADLGGGTPRYAKGNPPEASTLHQKTISGRTIEILVRCSPDVPGIDVDLGPLPVQSAPLLLLLPHNPKERAAVRAMTPDTDLADYWSVHFDDVPPGEYELILEPLTTTRAVACGAPAPDISRLGGGWDRQRTEHFLMKVNHHQSASITSSMNIRSYSFGFDPTIARLDWFTVQQSRCADALKSRPEDGVRERFGIGFEFVFER